MNASARTIFVSLGVMIFVSAASLGGPVANTKTGGSSADITLRGKLIEIDGTKPALDPGDKTILLAGRNHYVFATLEDKRLAGNEVELEGHRRPDGFFQVDDIHTIHHGKLYWIRYYCETCNISALAPGDCVCCQQPTELQEIPVGVPPGPNPKGVIITH